jgi:dihydrofolate reductase
VTNVCSLKTLDILSDGVKRFRASTVAVVHVTLFESISLNGMIGRPDGSGDFFTNYCWTGFCDHARAKGAMVWGRATHDLVRGWENGLADLAGVKGVVLTTSSTYPVEAGWTRAASPETSIEALKRQGADEMLVVGGQAVNTAFAAAGLLDEIMLFIESVVISPGLPLLAGGEIHNLRLRLLDVSRPTETVLQLRYEVLKDL